MNKAILDRRGRNNPYIGWYRIYKKKHGLMVGSQRLTQVNKWFVCNVTILADILRLVNYIFSTEHIYYILEFYKTPLNVFFYMESLPYKVTCPKACFGKFSKTETQTTNHISVTYCFSGRRKIFFSVQDEGQ